MSEENQTEKSIAEHWDDLKKEDQCTRQAEEYWNNLDMEDSIFVDNKKLKEVITGVFRTGYTKGYLDGIRYAMERFQTELKIL